MVTAGEPAFGIVRRLVLDDARERRTPPEMNRLVEQSPYETADVMRKVAPHLVRRVRQAVREFRGFGQQQQTRRLDRVARHADEPRFLPLLAALAVAVDHACDLAIHPMLDAQGPTLDTQIEFASGLGARNLGVERAPLRTRLAALHTEPLLDAE